MKGSLVLGKAFGIKIQIHWTFSLLLLYVVFVNLQQGSGQETILFNILLVLTLFLCVVLHELGHAQMARRFGIGTRSITLLPIGGVASLEKMPEKPREELAVALAGPAVNVVIAIILAILLPLSEYAAFTEAQWETFFAEPSAAAFLVYLLLANTILVIFNMIPAFPMDGGRVLRAILGFFTTRAQATEIAAHLGQAVSFAFLLLGLFFNPFLVVIAVFVFFGAYVENRMVQQDVTLKGHRVREALLTDITILQPDDPMQKAVDTILKGTEKDFIVSEMGRVVGILNYKDTLRAAANPEKKVRELMTTQFRAVSPEDELNQIMKTMSESGLRFLPVLKEGELAGAISTENISEFIMIRTARVPG